MFIFSDDTLPKYDPDKSFELLPEGEYAFQIDSVDIKKTKESQIPYLEIVSRVIDNPDYNGRKHFDKLFLFGEKNQYAKDTLAGYRYGTEFTGNFQVQPGTFSHNFSQLVGLVFQGKIRHRKSTYKGEEKLEQVLGHFKPYSFTPVVSSDGIPF